MRYEALEDKVYQGQWRVEAIGEDGEVYVTVFSGPNCQHRATEYAYWMNTKDTPFVFERQVRNKLAMVDGMEEVTLECGHVLTYVIPTSKYQTRLPCSECLNEWLDKRKEKGPQDRAVIATALDNGNVLLKEQKNHDEATGTSEQTSIELDRVALSQFARMFPPEQGDNNEQSGDHQAEG